MSPRRRRKPPRLLRLSISLSDRSDATGHNRANRASRGRGRGGRRTDGRTGQTTNLITVIGRLHMTGSGLHRARPVSLTRPVGQRPPVFGMGQRWRKRRKWTPRGKRPPLAFPLLPRPPQSLFLFFFFFFFQGQRPLASTRKFPAAAALAFTFRFLRRKEGRKPVFPLPPLTVLLLLLPLPGARAGACECVRGHCAAHPVLPGADALARFSSGTEIKYGILGLCDSPLPESPLNRCRASTVPGGFS